MLTFIGGVGVDVRCCQIIEISCYRSKYSLLFINVGSLTAGFSNYDNPRRNLLAFRYLKGVGFFEQQEIICTVCSIVSGELIQLWGLFWKTPVEVGKATILLLVQHVL